MKIIDNQIMFNMSKDKRGLLKISDKIIDAMFFSSLKNSAVKSKYMSLSENIYDKAAKEISTLYQMEKKKLTRLQEERNELLDYLFNHHTINYSPVNMGKINDVLNELESKIYEQNLVLIGIGKSYKRLCNKADMEN